MFTAPLGAACCQAADRETLALVVPVVFLVLPVTVVFALYPGFVTLTVTTP